MDESAAVGETAAMARHHHNVYACAKTVRYVVLFDLQWQVIDCKRLEPAADLNGAMSNAIRRLTAEGWIPEGDAKFGFVFIIRDGVRRLLILTERDPYDSRPQTFSPFK